ncbi:unnamed protein product [Bursaphelenchus xylophilus]|uniref:(pine wood nematode) hypothetical protein n=1 Tax=Bursaphelenchus xylophilus TaxID=6326 RepID=A0A1I7RS33_BURXY|nr:unnamed protein product [Bursaphelenchus xylophilus]CAG9123268.1 unnamed protein product [Bursaphelenchus xylophilus]
MIWWWLILTSCIYAAPVHMGPTPFWTSVHIQDLTWRPECIVDRNCADMTFTVSFESSTGEGRKQASWPLSQITADTSNAELTVYWKNSVQENITIDSSLTATDVLFNIPRPCDQSGSLRTFVPSIKALASNGPSSEYLVNPEETRIVGLVGKCYHAVAEIRLYKGRCPWCLEDKKEQGKEDVIVTDKLQLTEILESPYLIGAVLVCSAVFFIGIILGSYCLHKAYQIHKYNEHYTTTSLPDTVFREQLRSVSNIPMPPMLRPPLLPTHHHLNSDGPYTYPQYETLDSVVEKKEANYDSALDSSDTDTSPNGSFSEKREDKGDYV